MRCRFPFFLSLLLACVADGPVSAPIWAGTAPTLQAASPAESPRDWLATRQRQLVQTGPGIFQATHPGGLAAV